jgi:GT2 family glycosyltransferase
VTGKLVHCTGISKLNSFYSPSLERALPLRQHGNASAGVVSRLKPAFTLTTAFMQLSIIIVNWNSTDYLRRCLASIYKHTRAIAFEVIVVDNASPAQDVDVIRDEFPAVVLVKSRDNLGFAGANNLGVRHSSGDLLLFLNPDTELEEAAIEKLVAQLLQIPKAGILGCRLLNRDHTVQTSSIRRFPTIWLDLLAVDALRNRWPQSPLFGIAPLFRNCGEAVAVDAISGACMLVRRSVFESVGGFAEDYFMYAEDIDLCLKVYRAGHQNYYLGCASIVHFGGGSSSAGSATVMQWRAHLLFYRRNHGRMYLLAYRIVAGVNAILRLVLIATASLVTPRFRRQQRQDFSTTDKWRTILKVMLTEPARPQRGR